MLCKNVVELTNHFVQCYDNDNPGHRVFGNIRETVLGAFVSRGFQQWSIPAVVQVATSVCDSLEKRTRYIWSKLDQVITSTGVEPYPALNSDIQSFLSDCFSFSRAPAETFMEKIGHEAKLGSGEGTKLLNDNTTINNILPKLNAEVSLFCVKHVNDRKINNPNAKIGESKEDNGPLPKTEAELSAQIKTLLSDQYLSRDVRNAAVTTWRDILDRKGGRAPQEYFINAIRMMITKGPGMVLEPVQILVEWQEFGWVAYSPMGPSSKSRLPVWKSSKNGK
jgi:hypothetical protein